MITVDATKFSQRIQEWQKAAGVGAAQAVKTQAKAFVDACINKRSMTPPSSLSQGKKAVEDDLKKLFTPIKTGFLDAIGSEYGLQNIDTWRVFNGKKVHIKWDKIDVTGMGMRQFHKNNVTRRLRTREGNKLGSNEWKAKYVVSIYHFEKYVKTIQSHIGRLRAGWYPAAKELGVSTDSWISRHASGARGYIIMNLKEGFFDKPSITIQNHSVGVSRIERIIVKALRQRVAAMATDMKLYLSGVKKRMT